MFPLLIPLLLSAGALGTFYVAARKPSVPMSEGGEGETEAPAGETPAKTPLSDSAAAAFDETFLPRTYRRLGIGPRTRLAPSSSKDYLKLYVRAMATPGTSPKVIEGLARQYQAALLREGVPPEQLGPEMLRSLFRI